MKEIIILTCFFFISIFSLIIVFGASKRTEVLMCLLVMILSTVIFFEAKAYVSRVDYAACFILYAIMCGLYIYDSIKAWRKKNKH